MKKVAGVLLVLAVFAAAGCAKKTASEQMRDDMKKAGNQMKKDLNNL